MPELRVESGPQKSQTFFIRPPGPYLIGRDLSTDYPIFDRRVSRSHCRIDLRDDGYSITDLESKLGTYVGDEKVECALLKHGDHISIGRTTFTFLLEHEDDPLVGRTLGGFRILERVGKGGMGTVYRAVQLSLERIVALKVLSEEIARDVEFSALFVREAKAAGELSHPNIVRVYDVNSLDGVLFYVMEYMAHGSIEDVLRREGKLPVERALSVAIQAAQGLEYAEHERLVHRDIKPSNLMVHESGTVKLGDLGIAVRAAEHRPGQKPQGISGSPYYMSPEQALGRSVDAKSDVYSLGATLHQLLTGSPPFRGHSLKEILFAHVRADPPELRASVPDAPESLGVLLRSMLAKDPVRRPAITAVRLGLEATLATIARRPPEVTPLREPRWKPYALLVAMALLALSLGVGLGLFFQHLGSEISDSTTRLQRVRQTLEEGQTALRAGDLDQARRKLDEITRLPLPLDDWQIVQPDIERLENGIKRAGPRQ